MTDQQTSGAKLLKPVLLITAIVTVVYKFMSFGKRKPRTYNEYNLPDNMWHENGYIFVKKVPSDLLRHRQEQWLIISRL